MDRNEADLLVDHLMALSALELRALPGKLGIRSLKRKAEVRSRIVAAIKNGRLTTSAIVKFLDEVTPWGKQHVLLYRGQTGATKNWSDTQWVKKTLKTAGLDQLLGRKVPLVLPDELTLASIESSSSTLRITAVRRREGWVRDYDLVKHGKTEDGREVEYRGYVRQVLRGLVALEWDQTANEAMLQISQLPTGSFYENVANEFFSLIKPILDSATFTLVDVRRAIKKLRKLEQEGKGKVEMHGIGMDRLGSRRVTMRSTSKKVPLFGDGKLDDFIEEIEGDSIPRISDYFWMAKKGAANELDERRTHFVVVGERKRINFMTPSTEERVRNVLAELRRLSK